MSFGKKMMVQLGFAVLISTVLMSCAGPIIAADRPNVMIMGEDADQDTVPRHSRIFNRVAAEMKSPMQLAGFKVYDETAVAMDITNPGRVRRTDAELISVAQKVETPIDVIALFQIYASSQKNAYADFKELRIRISGRMIQVQTGRDLGNFEVDYGPKGLSALPINCNTDCILEEVGKHAKRIGTDVGINLTRKLEEVAPNSPKAVQIEAPKETKVRDLPKVAETETKACTGLSMAYVIVITGFGSEDINRMEEMMVSFQGYEHHRPLKTQTNYSEYWYETCADRARVERNLRTMTEQFPGESRVALAGNRFELQKVTSGN